MKTNSDLSRRRFLKRSATASLGLSWAVGLKLTPAWLHAADAPAQEADWVRRIAEPDIRAGVEAAVFKNLLPAATERVYPGHFTINADGGGYGSDST